MRLSLNHICLFLVNVVVWIRLYVLVISFVIVQSFVFLFGGCKFLAEDFYCFVNETDDTDTFLNSSNFHLQRPSHMHCNTIHFTIIINDNNNTSTNYIMLVHMFQRMVQSIESNKCSKANVVMHLLDIQWNWTVNSSTHQCLNEVYRGCFHVIVYTDRAIPSFMAYAFRYTNHLSSMFTAHLIH